MRNVQLKVLLTDYENRQLREEAERRGLNLSDLVRSLIARFPEPAHINKTEE